VFSGAGLAAGITVGALLAQDMLGATSLAGLPSALFTIGSAAAAAGAVGGMASGIVVATTSYAILALLGGRVAATVVPIIAATSLKRTPT
jgi:hypothetical protein